MCFCVQNLIISQNFCRQRSSSVFVKQIGFSVLTDVLFDSCRVLHRTAVSQSSTSSLPLPFLYQITQNSRVTLFS